MDLPSKTDRLIAKCKNIRTVKHVYFEPPETIRMEYPCIRIKRSTMKSTYASNRTYKIDDRYQLVYITREPDSEVVHDILWEFENIRHDNSAVADNLHHDYYTLYF